MPVKFQDFSIDVQVALDDVAIKWLYEASGELRSQTQRSVSTGEWTSGERTQLRDSYANVVDEGKGEAYVGSPLESAYWEEWGTGEHAAHGDGRKGWWVYIKDGASRGGGKSYKTKEEAEEAAEFLRKVKKLDAVVTNGRKPNYTLEHAFDRTKNTVINLLKQRLKERMDGK